MGVGEKRSSVAAKTAPAPAVDPSSPAFPGGAGNFRGARRPGTLGVDNTSGRILLAASTPAATSSTNTASKKAPPKTEEQEFTLLAEKTAEREVEIKVEVLRNAHSSVESDKAVTAVPGLPESSSSYETDLGKTPKITKYSFVWKGTLTIQTTFPTNLSPDDESSYGRGTGSDIGTGNVTLGFHEWCHRNDIQAYIGKSSIVSAGGTPDDYVLPESSPPVTIKWKYKKIPRFTGRIGQAKSDFKAAAHTFDRECKEWSADIGRFTDRCTDEFGFPKSKFKPKRRR